MIYVVVDFGEGYDVGNVVAAFRSKEAADKYAFGRYDAEVFEVELTDE